MNKFQKLACSYAKTEIKRNVEKQSDFRAIKNIAYSNWKDYKWPYRKCVDFNRWNREECKF